MQNRLLLAATTACVLAGGPALAQDDLWSGFYAGLNLGGSWGDASMNTQIGPGPGPIVIPPVDVSQINQTNDDDGNKTGFSGGGQIGYNWQSGSLVFGIETDYSFMDIDQSGANTYQSRVTVTPPIAPAPPIPSYTLEQRVQSNWMWTLRPRLGYAAGPWLMYATAGVASANVDMETKYRDTRTPPGGAQISTGETKTGWVAGLGGAYAFNPAWSIRGEWLYADLGEVRDTVTSADGFATLTSEAEVSINVIRVGMDYKF